MTILKWCSHCFTMFTLFLVIYVGHIPFFFLVCLFWQTYINILRMWIECVCVMWQQCCIQVTMWFHDSWRREGNCRKRSFDCWTAVTLQSVMGFKSWRYIQATWQEDMYKMTSHTNHQLDFRFFPWCLFQRKVSPWNAHHLRTNVPYWKNTLLKHALTFYFYSWSMSVNVHSP